MKARYTSLLSRRHLVRTGQLIVSRNHQPWICLPCALASIRATQAEAAPRPQQ
jgi:hypothetical protein